MKILADLLSWLFLIIAAFLPGSATASDWREKAEAEGRLVFYTTSNAYSAPFGHPFRSIAATYSDDSGRGRSEATLECFS